MDSSKMKIVYVITRRNDKSYWNRIGIAFVNSDGSINVRLDAVPISGEMQIRDYVPRDEFAGSTASLGSGNGRGLDALDPVADIT